MTSRDLLPFGTSPTQLSPFHHLVIILVRFACENFPHLLPRVLFAEETIGPLVRWRTGGGAAGLIREFGPERGLGLDTLSGPASAQSEGFWDDGIEDDDEDDERDGVKRPGTKTRRAPRKPAASTQQPKSDTPPKRSASAESSSDDRSFRAFWIGGDSQMPADHRRSSDSARSATTILYLHGGGMTLGSVAFYAEALIRILAKVCAIERKGGRSTTAAAGAPATLNTTARRMTQVEPGEARCIAVEYTLAPAARFPIALLECLRCYAHLIEVERIDPESIVIAGDSAGANLAMSILLVLSGQGSNDEGGKKIAQERDWSKLPMPGKAVLISPWVDLRPSHARAFQPLRKDAPEPDTQTSSPESASRRAAKAKRAKAKAKAAPQAAPARKTDPSQVIDDPHRWDYVNPETLLHFAQVYSGVLTTPRRVRGPIGWISHLCRVLGDGYPDLQRPAPPPKKASAAKGDDAEPNSSSTFMDPPTRLANIMNPPRRLARAAYRMLDDPIFLKSSQPSADEPGGKVALGDSRSADAYLGLDPLFNSRERQTSTVPNKSQLFMPFEETISASPGCTRLGETAQTMAKAADELDHNPLISPAIGDWSKIRLSKGALVVWGERELMSEDIELWVRKVRRESSTDASASASQSTAEDWIHAAVEKGPGGVHAWPLVSMYLAGTEMEREKGLDLLARFIARKDTGAGLSGAQAESLLDPVTGSGTDSPVQVEMDSPPHTPGSMPSDAGMYEPDDSLSEGEIDKRLLEVNQLRLDGVPSIDSLQPSTASEASSASSSGKRADIDRPRPRTPPRLVLPTLDDTPKLPVRAAPQRDYFSQSPSAPAPPGPSRTPGGTLRTPGGTVISQAGELSPVYLREPTRGRPTTPSRPIYWDSVPDSLRSPATPTAPKQPEPMPQPAETDSAKEDSEELSSGEQPSPVSFHDPRLRCNRC